MDGAVWPTPGERVRVDLRVAALAPPGAVDAVIQALFAHSTTGGVRRWRTLRQTLRRRELAVELARGVRVRVKLTEAPDGARLKPEYQDVVRAAHRLRRPALGIAREVLRRAEDALDDG